MKNIIFYIHGEWAFGSIHTEMGKFLLQHGINARLLDWTRGYTKESVQELAKVVDYFVTVPDGVDILESNYGIDPSQVIVCLHAYSEINYIREKFTEERLHRVKSLIAVSQYLIDECINNKFTRIPVLCEMGVNFESFNSPISDSLKTIGYAGTFHAKTQEINQADVHANYVKGLKRSYLVQEIAQKTNSPFKVAQWYTNTFVTMPGFYNSVDCIIVSSTTEGAGLPILEGLSAGKLILSTNVGIVQRMDNINPVILSMYEEDFVKEAVEIVNFYKKYPKLYQKMCLSGKEYAKRYDWSLKILPWVKEFNK